MCNPYLINIYWTILVKLFDDVDIHFGKSNLTFADK